MTILLQSTVMHDIGDIVRVIGTLSDKYRIYVNIAQPTMTIQSSREITKESRSRDCF